ncbi:MAG: response regulator [Treponemataceae bacterium]|nr:response regulator [Treponemataceae bacterium]
MYSVFIVDDEVIVREGIRSKIDWDNLPFTFAGEASDGELALSMIQEIKPDILITDIKMPFMDGLELAKNVKKMQPWIRIIILSGHDEFDYAKKAISIGVEDYILKPFTSDDLLTSMNKIASSLDNQKKELSDIARLKNEIEASSDLLREKFLSDLILGSFNSSDAIEKASELSISLLSRMYLVTISELHNEANSIDDLITAKSCLLSSTVGNPDIISFFLSPFTYVSIFKGTQADTLEEQAYSSADAIQHAVSKNTSCTVVTTIGSTVDRTALITKSYQDANHILELCTDFSKSRIIGSQDIASYADKSFSFVQTDPLMDRIKYATINELDDIIDQYLKLLGEDTFQFSVMASYLFIDVVMAASKLVEEAGGNIKDVIPDVLTHTFVAHAVENRITFIQQIRFVLEAVLTFRDSNLQGRYSDVILRAKKYIDENYANPDICLHSVAEEVHFSPNHFSTIFSQECGITFIEYLTSVRVDQAKHLLANSQKRSSDIAYEIGFNDPHYFSYIFKKATGYTPRDYRSNCTDNR